MRQRLEEARSKREEGKVAEGRIDERMVRGEDRRSNGGD